MKQQSLLPMDESPEVIQDLTTECIRTLPLEKVDYKKLRKINNGN